MIAHGQCPGAEHDKLKALAGTWDLTGTLTVDGATSTINPTGAVNLTGAGTGLSLVNGGELNMVGGGALTITNTATLTDHWSQQTLKAALIRVWQIHLPASGGTVYAGVEPAALFRSEDGGRSFDLVAGLWDHPDRPQWYPGGPAPFGDQFKDIGPMPADFLQAGSNDIVGMGLALGIARRIRTTGLPHHRCLSTT